MAAKESVKIWSVRTNVILTVLTVALVVQGFSGSSTAIVAPPHPSIAVSPSAFGNGAIVSVNGSGWKPGSTVHAWFDTNANLRKDAGEPASTATVLGDGTFTVPMTISGVPVGTYDIEAGPKSIEVAEYQVSVVDTVDHEGAGVPGTNLTGVAIVQGGEGSCTNPAGLNGQNLCAIIALGSESQLTITFSNLSFPSGGHAIFQAIPAHGAWAILSLTGQLDYYTTTVAGRSFSLYTYCGEYVQDTCPSFTIDYSFVVISPHP
jgi:hypothetical protein